MTVKDDGGWSAAAPRETIEKRQSGQGVFWYPTAPVSMTNDALGAGLAE